MTENKTYTTAAGYAEFRYEDRKSVFIGEALPVEKEEEALAFIEKVRGRFPDARHHVYAYLLRDGNKNRYSDDHEPQGSAGMPVLDVIRKNGCTDTVIVVTRYFGGILLGAGGLVRAYTAAAAGALAAAGSVTYRPFSRFWAEFSYADHGKLATGWDEGVKILESEYGDRVRLSLAVPEENADALMKKLTDMTSGRAVFGEKTGYFDHM